jgi:hypothetical protein
MTGRSALWRLLTTDPRDVGCGETQELLHVYVELAVAGDDHDRRHPGVAAHLRTCGPCREDFDGLVAAVRDLAMPSR